MTTTTAVILGVVLLAVLLVLFLVMRRRRTGQLQSRFGSEYSRVVEEAGGRAKAEAQLAERAKRVDGFTLTPLSVTDRETFVQGWRAVQARFVDDPSGAVAEADSLLGRVMGARGYPVSDFGQRAADLSVNHPVVVQNYRAGHEIAIREAAGQATTEDLRQAMLSYRSLFDELAGETPVAAARTTV